MAEEDKVRGVSPYDLRRILGDPTLSGVKLLGKKSDGSFENIKSDDEGRLLVYDPKVGSLISYSGTTTADGADDGSTLIDSVLATKPDFDDNLVIITSGDYAGQARGINGVTTGGTLTPDTAFDGKIVQGTTYVIIGIRSTSADIAILLARLTAARALLLDRLALLAAGGAGELTPGRATNLDYLDALVSGRAAPGDAMTLTAATLLAIQSLLLTDAHPFPGEDIALIKAETDKIPGLVGFIDLWSTFTTLFLGTGATTQSLPSITIDGIPNGASLVRAVMLLKFRAIHEDSGSDNYLDGAQEIQAEKAVAGSWLTGIDTMDGQLFCGLNSRDTGDVLVGQTDIKAQVPANGADINFQWLNSLAVGDSLYIEDIQVGLRIWFNLP